MGAYQRSTVHSKKHGGFWMRLVAFVIDMVIITMLVYLFTFVVELIVGSSQAVIDSTEQMVIDNQQVEVISIWPEQLAQLLVAIIVPWLYYTCFESSTLQATPGKRCLNLRVADTQNHQLTFARANARYWAKIISWLILTIGFWMIGWTKHKQGLHDKIAHTFVNKF